MSDLDEIWDEQIEPVLLENDRPLSELYELELQLDAEAIEPLVARLDDEDLLIVFGAGLLLARIDRADAIVPRLVPYLRDKHPLVAEHIRWVLRELGAPALPLLMDAYASQPVHKRHVASALGFQGPRAAAAAMVLAEDAKKKGPIRDAHRAIVGPWPEAPEHPLPYLGESIRMDADGPPPRERHGIEVWLEAVQWQAEMDENVTFDRNRRPEMEIHQWRPDQVAIAAPAIVVGAWRDMEAGVVTTTLHADDGARFTNQELLWKVLDAHHRIAPTNDRIYEGLKREDDGSYYISTGS